MCFENVKTKVKFQGTTTQAFEVARGLKQGPLPSTLFNLILKGMVWKANLICVTFGNIGKERVEEYKSNIKLTEGTDIKKQKTEQNRKEKDGLGKIIRSVVGSNTTDEGDIQSICICVNKTVSLYY